MIAAIRPLGSNPAQIPKQRMEPKIDHLVTLTTHVAHLRLATKCVFRGDYWTERRRLEGSSLGNPVAAWQFSGRIEEGVTILDTAELDARTDPRRAVVRSATNFEVFGEV